LEIATIDEAVISYAIRLLSWTSWCPVIMHLKGIVSINGNMIKFDVTIFLIVDDFMPFVINYRRSLRGMSEGV